MGCGSSKGKADDKDESIEFKTIGVASMDEFFQKCRDIIDEFQNTVSPYDTTKDQFLETSGFYEVPGTKSKHMIIGIILYFGTLAAGDLNNLIKFTNEAPFIDVDFDRCTGVKEFALKLWECMKSYAKSLKEIAEEKLPHLLGTAEQLPDEAEEVKNKATDEFNALDMMKKGKAVMQVGLNMKVLLKVPQVIKSILEKLKKELLELKDAIIDLKNNIVKMAKDALECIAKKLTKPFECYKQAFGSIKYTQDERTEWEKKMKTRAEKKGNTFNPDDYPKTDMIQSEKDIKKK